jgi:hypothetical protein
VSKKKTLTPPPSPEKKAPKTPEKEPVKKEEPPVKKAAPRKKKNKIDEAKETKQFFTILGICTLLLMFFLYLIFMKKAC